MFWEFIPPHLTQLNQGWSEDPTLTSQMLASQYFYCLNFMSAARYLSTLVFERQSEQLARQSIYPIYLKHFIAPYL